LVLIVRKLLLTAFALIVAVNRQSFNTLIRNATLTGEADFIDLAHMVDPNDTGKWPVTGAANGCTQDGVHELNVANLLENGSSVCGIYGNPFRNIDFSLH
jgi:hypothetical protein